MHAIYQNLPARISRRMQSRAFKRGQEKRRVRAGGYLGPSQVRDGEVVTMKLVLQCTAIYQKVILHLKPSSYIVLICAKTVKKEMHRYTHINSHPFQEYERDKESKSM